MKDYIFFNKIHKRIAFISANQTALILSQSVLLEEFIFSILQTLECDIY